MLILARRPMEAIVLMHPSVGEIRLRTMEIRRGLVRIGIEAPPWMAIFREEVLDPDAGDGTPKEGAV